MITKCIDGLCIIGILAAMTWALAFPTWIGQIYDINFVDVETESVEKSGVFGLKGGSPFEKIAPIWSPPKQAAPAFDAPVRMPWQPVTTQHHVDVSVAPTLFRFCLCSLVLGVLHRISVAFSRSENSFIGSVAWSTSLMSIIGCLVLKAIAVFTMGYGVTDFVIIAVTVTAMLAGIVHGTLQAAVRRKPIEGKSLNASWARGLGWTVLGMGIGFAFMLGTAGIVFRFRPSASPYAAAPVDHIGNLLAGGTTILIAWAIALALWRIVPKSLRNGFLFSATVLGVIACCHF